MPILRLFDEPGIISILCSSKSDIVIKDGTFRSIAIAKPALSVQVKDDFHHPLINPVMDYIPFIVEPLLIFCGQNMHARAQLTNRGSLIVELRKDFCFNFGGCNLRLCPIYRDLRQVLQERFTKVKVYTKIIIL